MKLKQLLFIALVSTSVFTSATQARDTDIYFLDPTAGGAVQPNLLFMIDTSGSMSDNISGTTLMRLDMMKQATLQVLDDLENTNAGMARFARNRAGAVVFPVNDIDKTIDDLTTANSAYAADKGNVTIMIQDGQDDADEPASSGSTVTNGTTLTLNSSSSNNGTQTRVGLRFRNVYIPKGVTITSAKILMKAGGDDSNNADLEISADNVEDALLYTAASQNIGTRTQTGSPVVWDNVPSFTDGNFYETPDLKTMVENIVKNQADWCYGNSMAFTIKHKSTGGSTDYGRRRIRAYDLYDDNANAALVVTYDYSTIPVAASYCAQTSSRVKASADDAEQNSSGTVSIVDTTLNVDNSAPTNNSYVGLRFANIKVPKNAVIKSAFLEMEVKAAGSGSPSVTVAGENTGNAAVFAASSNNISSARTWLGTTVAWSPLNPGVNQKASVEVTNIISLIVQHASWAEGNALALRLTPTGGGVRSMESFDDEPAAAPLLRIRYVTTGQFKKTVRDRLKEIVVGMHIGSDTPLVDMIYEGGIYFRGGNVARGKNRGSDPGGSANVDTRRFARVSHPASYTGGSLTTPAGCSAADWDSSNCVDQVITGTPKYVSPIAYQCQSNHMVLLTDGDATSNNAASDVRSVAGIGSCLTTYTMANSTVYNLNSDESCGIDMASFMFNSDQNSTFTEIQNVQTHTIGINIGNGFLEGVAKRGGGLYKTANDAESLAAAFQEILNEVIKDPTSFVSPSLSVNAFNRLYNGNEVYFTLFSPQAETRWPGNVKKYKLCGASTASCTFGDVIDATDQVAINPATGKIIASAQSFWSNPTVDGPEVVKGGAGSKLYPTSGRRAYSYIASTGYSASPDKPASPVDLTTSANQISTTNCGTAMFYGLLGVTTGACAAQVNWTNGQDIDTLEAAPNGGTTTDRWAFADTLHSRPITITYGGTVAAPVTKIVVGTNDGAVRMINATTGTEDWVVYIPEMLALQPTLRTNPEDVHTVGADGSPVVRTIDVNKNGIIEPLLGDKVQLFMSMRRGGRLLYAFDITPDNILTTSSLATDIKPKLMWRIKGGQGSYTALGETWSRPTIARVWVKCPTGDATCSDGVAGTEDSKLRTVLLFAGGYDSAFDADSQYTSADAMGNAIYMVDPDTGDRLWWAGGPSSGADLVMSDMKYSIPSDVAAYDSNNDGAVDRIYVGDTRAQLLRIDLSDQIDPTAATAALRNGGTKAAEGYVVADVGCTGGVRSNNCAATTVQDRRSFFYPPEIAQVSDSTYSASGATIYDYLAIGTGDREDPLDKKVTSGTPSHNRMYAFRDYHTGSYVAPDANTVTALTDSVLYNATTDVLFDTANAGYSTALASLKTAKGWYIDLSSAGTWVGEKILARSTIYAGVVYFTTYTPPQSSATPCSSPAEGSAKEFGVSLLSAAGVLTTGGARSTTVGGGIPSELVIVIREDGASGLIGTSGGAAKPSTIPKDLPRYKTYWFSDE